AYARRDYRNQRARRIPGVTSGGEGCAVRHIAPPTCPDCGLTVLQRVPGALVTIPEWSWDIQNRLGVVRADSVEISGMRPHGAAARGRENGAITAGRVGGVEWCESAEALHTACPAKSFRPGTRSRRTAHCLGLLPCPERLNHRHDGDHRSPGGTLCT